MLRTVLSIADIESELRNFASTAKLDRSPLRLYPLSLVDLAKIGVMDGSKRKGWDYVYGAADDYIKAEYPDATFITKAPFRKRLNGEVALSRLEAEAALAGLLGVWHGGREAFCFCPSKRTDEITDCRLLCDGWKKKVRRVAERLFYNGKREQLLLTEPPGVPLTSLFNAAAAEDANLIFPVNYSTAMNWDSEVFLSSFSAVEDFLRTDIAQCREAGDEKHKTRIIYVANPYNYSVGAEGAASFLGEGHYRQALSAVVARLIRWGCSLDELNDRLFFVAQPQDASPVKDGIVTALFDCNYDQIIDPTRLEKIQDALWCFDKLVLSRPDTKKPIKRSKEKVDLQHLFSIHSNGSNDFNGWLYTIPTGYSPGSDLADHCEWFEAVAPLKCVLPDEFAPSHCAQLRSVLGELMNAVNEQVSPDGSKLSDPWKIRNVTEFLGQNLENTGIKFADKAR